MRSMSLLEADENSPAAYLVGWCGNRVSKSPLMECVHQTRAVTEAVHAGDNENTNSVYDTPFICALFEEEGGDLFEVRQAVLGHLQPGGTPTPFDRIQTTRFAVKCIEYLEEKTTNGQSDAAAIGLNGGKHTFDFRTLLDDYDLEIQRPQEQWWMKLRPVARMLAQPSEHFIELEE